MKKNRDEKQVKCCAQLIDQSQSIVVLTGAGISTSAGIPDFRGPKGLYVTRQYDPETVFDINHFLHDPKPFYQFARDFIALEEKITPTLAHRFLAKLETVGKLKGIITQNIDSLHQRSGSNNVLEFHGSFWNSHCLKCPQTFSYPIMKEKLSKEDVAHCSCGGIIKPDIVFFGENVKCLQESIELAQEADLFFVIGTSCVVYPAAMLPQYTNGQIVVVNLGEVKLNLLNISLSVNEDTNAFFQKVANELKMTL